MPPRGTTPSSAKYSSIPSGRRVPRNMQPGRKDLSDGSNLTIYLLLGAALLLTLLGCIYFWQHQHGKGMSLSSSSSSSDYSVFLVDKKFKKDKLDKNDLEDLVGLHFVSEPNYDELKALHEKGVKDWVEDRLNVHLDGDSRIKKAKYG